MPTGCQRRLFILCGVVMVMTGCAVPRGKQATRLDETPAVASVLDSFHAAAARADGKHYFEFFAQDSVFLGTDARERWTREEFRAFAQPYFEKGKGWTYTPRDRHVSFVPGQRAASVAYFDELLDNSKYGVCRGSGVLVRVKGAWKIAQYNLSKPIPNEAMEAVNAAIAAQK